MRVNVFTRTDSRRQNLMLAVPANPEEMISLKLRKRWQYFATVDTSDAMFRLVKVEEDISAQGYCVFIP